MNAQIFQLQHLKKLVFSKVFTLPTMVTPIIVAALETVGSLTVALSLIQYYYF